MSTFSITNKANISKGSINSHKLSCTTVSEKEQKKGRKDICKCAHLTVSVFGRWYIQCGRDVVGSSWRHYEVPPGSMILVYLCLWATLLSACCLQCQDHHGKSLPMGNTTDQGLNCESSFSDFISSGQTGPSELRPEVSLKRKKTNKNSTEVWVFLGLTCQNVGIVTSRTSFIRFCLVESIL